MGRSSVLLTIFLGLVLSCLAGPCDAVQKKFVIGGWVGPLQTEEQYLLYRQAGFNTLLDYPWEGDDYHKTLQLAEKVGGLDVMFCIDQMFLAYKPEPFVPYERIAKFIKQVRNHPLVIGYDLYDEPKAKDVALLVAAGKYIRSLDPDKLTWISFFLHNDKLARTILDQFVPTVISSPEYPFRAKDDLMDELYKILETYRAIALQYKVPLWLFVQSSSWPWLPNPPDDRREPTVNEMRMQVYSNLAYGAKALWYYTYATPRAAKGTSVILDRNGGIRPAYHGVKAINTEVQAMGPILMSLTSVDVMHVRPNHQWVKPFTPNNIVADVSADNILIGYFKDTKGVDYLMLVNKLTKGADSRVSITLRDKDRSLFRIDKTSGRPVRYPVSQGVATVTLRPGDGILLRLD